MAGGLVRVECVVGWDAAGDVEGAVGCDVDDELEEFVDSSLPFGCGIDEASSGVFGELLELPELCWCQPEAKRRCWSSP